MNINPKNINNINHIKNIDNRKMPFNTLNNILVNNINKTFENNINKVELKSNQYITLYQTTNNLGNNNYQGNIKIGK